MGGAVSPDQPRPVYGQHHRQVLQQHVVYPLVVRPLQESGIYGHHRPAACCRHAGGEGDAVLLRYADVMEAPREALLELDHARALAHGRGDAHQPVVPFRHVAQPAPEDRAVGLLGLGLRFLPYADLRVKLADPVVQHGVSLGRGIALALLGYHMQQLRPVPAAQLPGGRHQALDAVPVHRPYVVEAQRLEQRPRRNQYALHMLLGPLRQVPHPRGMLQQLLAPFPDGVIQVAGHDLRHAVRERPDIGRYGHLVVVQHHQDVRMHLPGVVQRLKGHPGRHPAVAYYCHAAAPVPGQPVAQRHPQRGAYGSA